MPTLKRGELIPDVTHFNCSLMRQRGFGTDGDSRRDSEPDEQFQAHARSSPVFSQYFLRTKEHSKYNCPVE